MNKHDETLLRHILEASESTAEFIGSMSFDDFASDKKTVAAVVRQLEIIGEAMGRISKEFLAEHPEFNVHDAISMRNILIHEYFDVDVQIVWDTCHENLPPLQDAIHILLNQ